MPILLSSSARSIRLLPVAVLYFSTLAYAADTTAALGTASARGDMLVDGETVQGDATIFEGSVAETGQTTASLRIEEHVKIDLDKVTRGITHRGWFVLEKGTIEWEPPCNYLIEVNGLRVTPDSPNSRGLVSIDAANVVIVSAIKGEFRVMDNHGLILARASVNSPARFASNSAQGITPTTYFGEMTRMDTHYLLHLLGPDHDVSYEVRGPKADKYVGKKVEVVGEIAPALTSTVVYKVLQAKKEKEICCCLLGAEKKVVVPLAVAGAGAATAAGIALASGGATPASR